jgi:hypothetical protein
LVDGSVDGHWTLKANEKANTLVLSGKTLYVGGTFDSIGLSFTLLMGIWFQHLWINARPQENTRLIYNAIKNLHALSSRSLKPEVIAARKCFLY